MSLKWIIVTSGFTVTEGSLTVQSRVLIMLQNGVSDCAVFIALNSLQRFDAALLNYTWSNVTMSDREPTRWHHNRIYPHPMRLCCHLVCSRSLIGTSLQFINAVENKVTFSYYPNISLINKNFKLHIYLNCIVHCR